MGKLELNKKKKKDALYSTAFELFTTRGLAKTTISDIVEKAGVAKGTFYLYFKDKYDIRNKLISHKTGELFYKAYQAVMETDLTGFEPRLFFLIDYILDALAKDKALLLFISKNLSWGMFRGAFDEKLPDDGPQMYSLIEQLMADSGFSGEKTELMLFTIIELVGSTCHSCILYQQPMPMEEYKPYLYEAIRHILRSFSSPGPGEGNTD
ncbi:MAG: TetR/AcrR family transcriptional regulator [Blautia sp.]|nr:TetR/AcrR family transcriptional regulator [Blautia sp.]